jgi:hypothetical protein
MADKNGVDFYFKIKWHAVQIVALLGFLAVLYKVLKGYFPSFPWPF